MSHAFVKNHIHLAFGTKDRHPSISKDVQPELWSYMAGICRNQGMVPISINGMSDHAHVLFHLPPTIALAKAVQLLKTNSSKMDERSWTPFRLAGWIRRIQRERFEHGNRGEIYPQSGAASPQDDVRRRISSAAEETRHRSRCFITAWLCRPAKAGLELLLTLPTAYLPQQTKNGFAGDPGRGGLNNSALRADIASPSILIFTQRSSGYEKRRTINRMIA
jgi:REP element-mobilizing transposase RayT